MASFKALVWFKRLGFRVREFGGWKRCSVSLLVRLVLSKGLISLTPMQAREFVDAEVTEAETNENDPAMLPLVLTLVDILRTNVGI